MAILSRIAKTWARDEAWDRWLAVDAFLDEAEQIIVLLREAVSETIHVSAQAEVEGGPKLDAESIEELRVDLADHAGEPIKSVYVIFTTLAAIAPTVAGSLQRRKFGGQSMDFRLSETNRTAVEGVFAQGVDGINRALKKTAAPILMAAPAEVEDVGDSVDAAGTPPVATDPPGLPGAPAQSATSAERREWIDNPWLVTIIGGVVVVTVAAIVLSALGLTP